MKTTVKTCFKCGEEKPLRDFYKHHQMRGGRLNKCAECTKKDAKAHRLVNLEKIREYDRRRGSRQSVDYLREYRARYPKKEKAHRLINYDLRKGKIEKRPCEVCGTTERIEAHHDDYDKPREVRWLCSVHHKQWHAENGPGLNGDEDAA